MKQRYVKKSRSSELGFSLIEVLISILVLSFAVLGMVGLQAMALQSNREARAQSQAVTLARELAEMMRGNKDVALLGTAPSNPYLGSFSGSPLKPQQTSDCLNPGSSCLDVGATAQLELARAEMTDWLRRAEQILPGARIEVCFDAAPFDVEGRPKWSCVGGALATTVIKIGWTSVVAGDGGARVINRGERPSVVVPVTPGSTE
jgi:type IV pilus assembly protein PilV